MPRRLPRRLLIALFVTVTLTIGLFGFSSYVSHYYIYRGFTIPTRSPGIPSGRVATERFSSPALGRSADYVIYLPPGYSGAASRGVRFPVLYLLHPPADSARAYVQIGALAVRMDALIAARRFPPFIVVMPNAHTSRYGDDTEWANARAGRYEDLVLDCVRAVDHRWSTSPQRADRGIGGLSEGGYGAANVALHHLRTFGVMESWSGYFTQTPSAAFTGASPAALRANSPSNYVGSLSPKLGRLPLRVFLYQGRADHSSHLAGMLTFAAQLRAAGADVHVAVYRGGHNWRVWRTHMPAMLSFAGHGFPTSARGAL